MTNILMCHICVEPTNVMFGEFFEQMSERELITFRQKLSKDVCAGDIEWADVIFTSRAQDALTASILDTAKKHKKFVFFFIDDDFFSLPEHHIRRALEEKYLLKAMKSADVIAGSNAKLAAKMCDRVGCDRNVVIETAIAEEELQQPKCKEIGDTINIVYYTSDGATISFDNHITPILTKLADRLGKKINLTCYTVNPEIPDDSRITLIYKDRMPLSEFRSSLRNGGFDIGIVPLSESEFNSCKYINKFMEFTRAGIPGIYSDASPYREFIVDGEIGTICENDLDSWVDAFEKNMSSQYRAHCINSAQNLIRKQFSYDAIIDGLIKEVPELVNYKAPTEKLNGIIIAKIKFYLSCICLPFSHAIGRAKIEGIGSVFSWGIGHYIQKKR